MKSLLTKQMALLAIVLIFAFSPAVVIAFRTPPATPIYPIKLSELTSAEFEPISISGEVGFPAYFTGPNPANYHTVPMAPIVNAETFTLTGASGAYNTNLVPSTTAHEAVINLTFGTVTGSFTTCTAQLNTTIDGVNFLTLGSAQSITVTSNHVNAWTIIEQTGTTSVTSGAVSATAALSFGQQSYLALACSAYGTTAPATLSITYK